MYSAIAPTTAYEEDSGRSWSTPAPPARRAFEQIAIGSIRIGAGARDAIDLASLADLADNIRTVGVLQPIIVRPLAHRGFELLAGERRMRAAKIAGLSTIPALVMHDVNGGQAAIGLFENIHRQNLSQIEEARGLKRLLLEHGTLDQVSRRISKSKAWISERLQLLELGPTASALIVDRVTSDVDVINAINRAARLDPTAAERLSVDVRAAEKKREVARHGLSLIRRQADAASTPESNDVDARRDLGRLAAEIIRIASSDADRAARAREMRQTLSCSDHASRERLEALLRTAFDLGRQASRDAASSLTTASEDLLAMLAGRPRLLQQLIIRSYSVALTTDAFDFQQISIG